MSIHAQSLDDYPFNSFHKKLTLCTAGGPFLDGYVMSITGVSIIQISEALHLSSFSQGGIAAAVLVGIFFGGSLGGWLTDKFGRKLLYIINAILITIISGLQFFSDSALFLFLLRFLIGMMIGADYPISTALLVEFLPRKHRGPLLASLVIMWFVGAAAAFVIGGSIFQMFGDKAWRWVLCSSIIPGIVICIARLTLPESPRWLITQGRLAHAKKVIGHAYGSLPSSHLNIEADEHHVPFSALLKSGYGKRMIFVVIFWSCAIVPQSAIYAFAPTVLKSLEISSDWATYGSIIITLMFLFGTCLATISVNRLGRRKMLIGSFVFSSIPLVLIGFSSNIRVVIVLFCFYSVFIGGAQILTYVYPNELFPTNVRASAVGLGTSLSRISAATGTYLVPISLSSLGAENTMFIAGAISAVGAACAYYMAPETSKMDLKEASSIG